MTTYGEKRIDILNNWENNSLMEMEAKFLSIINNEPIILPVKMIYDENREYQICISFLIDAFNQLPKNPEIGLDRVLLALDCYSNEKKLINVYEAAVDKVDNAINRYGLNDLFMQICQNIPARTQTYLASRIFKEYEVNKDIDKQTDVQTKRLWTRMSKINGNYSDEKIKVKQLLEKIAQKYELNNKDNQYSDVKEYDGKKRNIGRLLRLSLIQSVNINGTEFDLSNKNKLNLLIQGLLQTIRNDRMHGNDISPFKSSKSSIESYKHYYYCLILAYFVLLLHFDNCLEHESFVRDLEKKINDSLGIVHSW